MEKKEPPLNYDFDVHQSSSYYYYFVKQYLDTTWRVLHNLPINYKSKIVYDIGIGRGRGLVLYKKLGIKKIIGIDIERDETDYAIKKANILNLELTIKISDSNNLVLSKIKDETADIVILMYILCFVPKSTLLTIIHHAKRIVKPGGIIVVVDMPKPSLMWFFNTITLKHRNFLTKKQWQTIFRPLTLISQDSSNFFYFLNTPASLLGKLFGEKIYNLLDRTAKQLGFTASTITFIFQKMK